MLIPKYLSSIFKSDLLLPIFLILTYIIFVFLIRGVVPTGAELIKSFEGIYAKYGYEIILVAAFLECLILINFFVPGVVAMALGAIFASTGKIELSLVILTASIGGIAGYIIDYILGSLGLSDIFKKFGLEKIIESAKYHINSLGIKGLFIGFSYPATGAIVATASGTVKYPFVKYLFVCAMSVFFWMSFWGLLFFFLGSLILPLITKYSYIILGLIILSFYLVKLINKKSAKIKD